MEFILLQSFTNYIEAHILMGKLEDEGIVCWLKDENTVTINPIWTGAVGGIKLMVTKDQLERALQLMQQYTQERKNAVACPNCGSHEIEFVSSPRKPLNWVSALTGFFFGDYAVASDKTWHCFACNTEFDQPVDMVPE
jgi:predicted RNA-binding Zn-ribbon protein involved in translation (DUF1610 family)